MHNAVEIRLPLAVVDSSPSLGLVCMLPVILS